MIVIDRFEGDCAVLETDEGMVTIHRGHLPGSAREGDVLRYYNGGYTVDREAGETLRSQNRDKLRELLSGGGND